MVVVRKRQLSRVTPFYFRPLYGFKLSKVMTDSFNSAKREAAELNAARQLKSKKKVKKLKFVKKIKPGFRFFFRKDLYLPPSFARKRISVHTGKSFFSFVVKLRYVYTRLSEFVSTTKFGPSIHKKAEKKKKKASKKK